LAVAFVVTERRVAAVMITSTFLTRRLPARSGFARCWRRA
jgi:hypothetical protein